MTGGPTLAEIQTGSGLMYIQTNYLKLSNDEREVLARYLRTLADQVEPVKDKWVEK